MACLQTRQKSAVSYIIRLVKPRRTILFLLLVLLPAVFLRPGQFAHGAGFATLSLGPGSGTFIVGGTFTVSVFLDTGNESANALDVTIAFPPDKLQVVSPSTGKSIIGIWASQPSFDNQRGLIRYQGGIPNPGINTTNGLVSTITFRAKTTGRAVVRFEDSSKVFLNDGLGTEFLGNTISGVYELVLPPPEGPIVSSATHPDQSRWYNASTALLEFASNQDVDGYSYVLDDQPIGVPDDISEGSQSSVSYKNLPSGTRYFHIRALKDGTWGGITHFAINVDTEPPAEFPVDIVPSKKTVRKNPIISFETTDYHSGLDHYEIKLINLTSPPAGGDGKQEQAFFIEASSPYIPTLTLGNYDVIVRAFDKAGNERTTKVRLEIVTALFEFIGSDGVRLRGNAVVPWIYVIPFSLLLLVALGIILWSVRKWYLAHHSRLEAGAMNDPVIRARLKELETKKREYGHILAIFLAVGLCGFLVFGRAEAADQQVVSPPIMELVSQDISNEELFYVGGRVDIVDSEVLIYLQNVQTGETFSITAETDKTGSWFYSHNTFLSPGRYLLWAQSRLGGEMSPPSPQVQMTVTETALQFGATRLSYETLYLGMVLALSAACLGLLAFIMFYIYHGHKMRLRLRKEVREAEDAVRRGFAILQHDLEAELSTIQKLKLRGELKEEESAREEKLLKDIEAIKLQIGREITDIERMV